MFVYSFCPGQVQVTDPTPLTQLICGALIATGTGNPTYRPSRTIGFYVHGRGAGLTAISGLSFRLRRMDTGSLTGGSGAQLRERDGGVQNARWSGLFAGTAITDPGTPTLLLSIGCGAAGASGWFAANDDSALFIEGDSGGASAPAKRLNVLSASGLASMNYEFSLEEME